MANIAAGWRPATVRTIPIIHFTSRTSSAAIVPFTVASALKSEAVTWSPRSAACLDAGGVTRRAGAQRRTAQPLTRLVCGGYPGLSRS